MKSQCKYLIGFSGLVVGLLTLQSCMALKVVTPEMGATKKVFSNPDGEYVSNSQYDFSRLQNGYGLYVFSYDYLASEGNNITGWTRKNKRGIRVWEYKFAATDGDTKLLKKNMFYVAYRSPSSLFLFRSGYKFPFVATFKKGKIVYGGCLVADQATFFREGPHVTMRMDSDIGAWLRENATALAGIQIDTAEARPTE